MPSDEEVCRSHGIRFDEVRECAFIDIGPRDKRVVGVAVVSHGARKLMALLSAIMSEYESATFEIKWEGVPKP